MGWQQVSGFCNLFPSVLTPPHFKLGLAFALVQPCILLTVKMTFLKQHCYTNYKVKESHISLFCHRCWRA